MAIIGKTGGCAVALFAVMVGGAALGAESKGRQKCINTLNKDTAKVAATQGKNDAACVKSARKGAPSSTCVPNDGSGKVAGTVTKAGNDEIKNDCLGANAPDFGYGGVNAGTTAAVAAEVNLFADTYGGTDTGVISTAKADGKCQAAVIKDLEKLMAKKWKVYLGCKKAALATATDNSPIAGCMENVGSDPKVQAALLKLQHDINKDCANFGTDFAGVFPGSCSTAGGILSYCLDSRSTCRLCLALNAIDDLSVDCDIAADATNYGPCFQPGGRMVGGSLWYIGKVEQDCDQTCAAVGKAYSTATQTFAGDLGTDPNCLAVLNAFGIAGVTLDHPSYACSDGLGCGYQTGVGNGSFRCATPATTSTAVYEITYRACACQ